MLIQPQLLSSIQRSFSLPCSAAAILQAAKTKERCVKSPLCFLCFHWKCAVGFLHIYMCCVCDWFTQIVVEEFLLFFKNIPGWLALIGTHF